MGQGRFGRGWIADTHDMTKDWSIRGLLGAHTGLPREATLESYIPKVYDQGQTSSCVGWAFAQTVATRCAVMGTPIPFPSPSAIYTFARAIGRLNSNVPLTDDGSIPKVAVTGMNQWGIPSIDAWPFDPAAICNEPDLKELEVASAFKLNGYYRIASHGQGRLDDVRQALASGYPVAFGTQVDQAFEDYGPSSGILKQPTGKLYGGHMLHLVGYRSDGTFRALNQWSEGWGQSGFMTLAADYLLSQWVSDLYVITVSATGHNGGVVGGSVAAKSSVSPVIEEKAAKKKYKGSEE